MTAYEQIDASRARKRMVLARFVGTWVTSAYASFGVPLMGALIFLSLAVVAGIWPQFDQFIADNFALWLVLIFLAPGLIALASGSFVVAWAARVTPLQLILAAEGSPAPETVEALAARGALEEMSIAAGLGVTPPLYVLPGLSTVNAVLAGSSAEDLVVGVTEGALTYLSREDLEAVFASLLARDRLGGASWTTTLAALMWLVVAMRASASSDPDSVESFDRLARGWSAKLFIAGAWFFKRYARRGASRLERRYNRDFDVLAKCADSEGLMLLRDPAQMLRTLEAVHQYDNELVFGERLNYLAYVRPFLAQDVYEIRRIEALKGLAGASGAGERPRPHERPVLEPSYASTLTPEQLARRERMHEQRQAGAPARERLMKELTAPPKHGGG